MVQLEPREQLVFDYIKENIKTNGYPPSVRDICSALHIKSTSTVHACLERLEQKGYIQKVDGKSRGLRIGGSENELSSEGANAPKIPLIGNGTGGAQILAEENYEGYISYPADSLHPSPECEMLAVRVVDNGMTEAGILRGDIVIIEKTPVAENGDIVAVLLDDEIAVRTFYKDGGHFRLQPENRTMFPVIVTGLTIIGRVITCIRHYNKNT